MTISWLAGGSYQSIRAHAGYSVPSFYRVLYEVIETINEVEVWKIDFPNNRDLQLKMAAGFKKISSNHVITGCVGAIDGWLCPIITPTPTKVGRVTAFSLDITNVMTSMYRLVVTMFPGSLQLVASAQVELMIVLPI